MAIIQVYEKDGQIFTRISSNGQSKDYDSGSTKMVLDKLTTKEMTNLKYINNNITFIYQGMEFQLINYSNLKKHSSCEKFNKKITTDFGIKSEAKEKIKKEQSHKVNRNRSKLLTKIMAGALAVSLLIQGALYLKSMAEANDNDISVISEESTSSYSEPNKVIEEEEEIIKTPIEIQEETSSVTKNSTNQDEGQTSVPEVTVKQELPEVDNKSNLEEPETEIESNLEETKQVQEEVIENPIEYEEEIQTESKTNTAFVTMEIPDYSDSSEITRSNYGAIITKYANMYGIDPDIMIAIATQESGGNPNEVNNYASGLMQLETIPWITRGSIDAFNFKTNKWDTIYVNENNITDLETNIAARCAYLQEAIEKYNGNIALAIFAGNGEGNVSDVLNATSNQYGINKQQIIDIASFLGWIDFTHVMPNGDSNYIYNIFKRIPREIDGSLNLTCKRLDGTNTCLNVTTQRTNTR